MGVGVAAGLLAGCPATAGLLLLHNTGGSDGAEVRAGLPVQLHIADPDEYQSPAKIAAWAAPDEEVHALVNELERPVGTYLFGRRMYETMRYWETAHTVADQRPVALDFARIRQAADKIVYSITLQTPDTARTRIERDFDPVQVRKLKQAADRDLTVGGARLAAQAIAAGLVDEYQLFVVVGMGAGRFITSNQRDFPATLTEVQVTHPAALVGPPG